MPGGVAGAPPIMEAPYADAALKGSSVACARTLAALCAGRPHRSRQAAPLSRPEAPHR